MPPKKNILIFRCCGFLSLLLTILCKCTHVFEKQYPTLYVCNCYRERKTFPFWQMSIIFLARLTKPVSSPRQTQIYPCIWTTMYTFSQSNGDSQDDLSECNNCTLTLLFLVHCTLTCEKFGCPLLWFFVLINNFFLNNKNNLYFEQLKCRNLFYYFKPNFIWLFQKHYERRVKGKSGPKKDIEPQELVVCIVFFNFYCKDRLNNKNILIKKNKTINKTKHSPILPLQQLWRTTTFCFCFVCLCTELSE